MTPKTGFSDDDLTRFIDKEAGQERSALIQDALSNDVLLNHRVEELTQASDGYKAAFDDLLAFAPEMPYIEPAQTTRSFGHLGLAAASMAAGVVLALGLTYSFQSAAQADWKDVVANYQSLYVSETLTTLDISSAQQIQSLSELSDRLGFDIKNLPDIDGLEFVRAQELGFEGRPLAQLTFLNSENGPVALCIVQTGKETSEAIEFAKLHGMDTYSWSHNGFGILLVGPKNDETLQDAADKFRSAFLRNNA